jgi:hypothetical protein
MSKDKIHSNPEEMKLLKKSLNQENRKKQNSFFQKCLSQFESSLDHTKTPKTITTELKNKSGKIEAKQLFKNV